MDNCKSDLTYKQILQNFGSDEMMKICKTCDNLVYEDGIMTCRLLSEGVNSK